MEFNANKLYYDKGIDIKTKLNYLKKYRANILVRSYVYLLINNLYIEIDALRRGYAKEMVNDMKLTDYCWESTESIAPFFKDNDEIIRGMLSTYQGGILNHSWIKFNLKNKEYVFDPSFNVIVLKEIYDKIFSVQEEARVNACQVKLDMIDILTNSSTDNFSGMHMITYNNDINNSFYKTNMYVSGEEINKKILTLKTKFNNK